MQPILNAKEPNFLLCLMNLSVSVKRSRRTKMKMMIILVAKKRKLLESVRKRKEKKLISSKLTKRWLTIMKLIRRKKFRWNCKERYFLFWQDIYLRLRNQRRTKKLRVNLLSEASSRLQWLKSFASFQSNSLEVNCKSLLIWLLSRDWELEIWLFVRRLEKLSSKC